MTKDKSLNFIPQKKRFMKNEKSKQNKKVGFILGLREKLFDVF